MPNQPLDTYQGFTRPTSAEHLPSVPLWHCGWCGEEWPCLTARDRLKATTGRTQLAILMWNYLEEYARDAGPGPLHGAFERFIGWTRKGKPWEQEG